jgi:hypothetical protein
MKLAELSIPCFYLGYYISSQFDILCNIVQLLLLSVAMTNALLALFFMHIVYNYVYLYMLCFMYNDFFHSFGLIDYENKLQ